MQGEYVKLKAHIDKNLVLRYLGFRENKTIVTENLWSIIDETIYNSQRLLYPLALYKTFKINKIDFNSVHIENVEGLIISEDIASLLYNSHFITIMAVTVGSEIEKEIDLLFKKGEYTKASVLDAAASAGAETAADSLNNIIEEEAKLEGFNLTRRFSPGYGDFELDCQSFLLGILEAEKINLKVSSGNILIPKKSITALMGWTKDLPELSNKEDKCKDCSIKNCKYKLTGVQCH